MRRVGAHLAIEIVGDERLQIMVGRCVADGISLISAVPRTEKLEDLFVREAIVETPS